MVCRRACIENSSDGGTHKNKGCKNLFEEGHDVEIKLEKKSSSRIVFDGIIQMLESAVISLGMNPNYIELLLPDLSRDRSEEGKSCNNRSFICASCEGTKSYPEVGL